MEVREYTRQNGSSPFRDWFDALDFQAALKVGTARSRLEQGNFSNVKWFEGIGELKINRGPGYRIYLAKDGHSLIVLFGGGTKKRQQADIVQAKSLHAEYKARKAALQRANIRIVK